MAKRYYNSGSYEGMESRRTQEAQDAGMIRENPAAIANLPQEVMMKPWPAANSYIKSDLDDTIAGVNRQMDVLDGAKRDKNLAPKKV